MTLFTIESGIVKPTPEILTIPVFGEIWNRDASSHKEQALKEFAYIEFMCSFKSSNPYAGYSDEMKEFAVKRGIFREQPDWQPDEIVTEAIETYKDFQANASPSLRFYQAALEGIKKLQDFYKTLDMSEKTNQGALVNKPSEVARSLSQTAAILQNLQSLKTKVEQELFESNRIRANREVNPFER